MYVISNLARMNTIFNELFLVQLIASILLLMAIIIILIKKNAKRFVFSAATLLIAMHLAGSNYLYTKAYQDDWNVIQNNKTIVNAYMDVLDFNIDEDEYETWQYEIYNSPNIFNGIKPKSELGRHFKSMATINDLPNNPDASIKKLVLAYCISEAQIIGEIWYRSFIFSFITFNITLFLILINGFLIIKNNSH